MAIPENMPLERIKKIRDRILKPIFETKQFKILVKQAIRIVKELNKLDGGKKDLLTADEDKFVYLQVCLRKMHFAKSFHEVKVGLPHPFFKDNAEVCLFTKDLDKNDREADSELTVAHYKEILKKHGVTNVTQIIPLRQLRKEYKTHEMLRQLLYAYDKFLMDYTIAPIVGSLLGQQFVQKRKFPLQIDMHHDNLKACIDEALHSAVFFISNRGNLVCSEIATLGMDDEFIMENIIKSIECLSKKIRGDYKKFLGLYVKTQFSKAIPIHLAFHHSEDVKTQRLIKSVLKLGPIELPDGKNPIAKSIANTSEQDVLKDSVLEKAKTSAKPMKRSKRKSVQFQQDGSAEKKRRKVSLADSKPNELSGEMAIAVKKLRKKSLQKIGTTESKTMTAEKSSVGKKKPKTKASPQSLTKKSAKKSKLILYKEGKKNKCSDIKPEENEMVSIEKSSVSKKIPKTKASSQSLTKKSAKESKLILYKEGKKNKRSNIKPEENEMVSIENVELASKKRSLMLIQRTVSHPEERKSPNTVKKVKIPKKEPVKTFSLLLKMDELPIKETRTRNKKQDRNVDLLKTLKTKHEIDSTETKLENSTVQEEVKPELKKMNLRKRSTNCNTELLQTKVTGEKKKAVRNNLSDSPGKKRKTKGAKVNSRNKGDELKKNIKT